MGGKKTRYLSTRRAAKHLGLSVRTLNRYRVSGGGPGFLRLGGQVRYLREELDRWAKCRPRTSTSDDGADERPDPPPRAGTDR